MTPAGCANVDEARDARIVPVMSRALRAVVALVLVGCAAQVVRLPDSSYPFDPAIARRMTVQEVERRRATGEAIIFVDARADTGDTIIQGAVHVPEAQLETWAKNEPLDALIVTYCT